jgi:hypothetical protein
MEIHVQAKRRNYQWVQTAIETWTNQALKPPKLQGTYKIMQRTFQKTLSVEEPSFSLTSCLKVKVIYTCYDAIGHPLLVKWTQNWIQRGMSPKLFVFYVMLTHWWKHCRPIHANTQRPLWLKEEIDLLGINHDKRLSLNNCNCNNKPMR